MADEMNLIDHIVGIYMRLLSFAAASSGILGVYGF